MQVETSPSDESVSNSLIVGANERDGAPDAKAVGWFVGARETLGGALGIVEGDSEGRLVGLWDGAMLSDGDADGRSVGT
jgi:hypothetical protein